jgi:hypothetical protein
MGTGASPTWSSGREREHGASPPHEWIKRRGCVAGWKYKIYNVHFGSYSCAKIHNVQAETTKERIMNLRTRVAVG